MAQNFGSLESKVHGWSCKEGRLVYTHSSMPIDILAQSLHYALRVTMDIEREREIGYVCCDSPCRKTPAKHNGLDKTHCIFTLTALLVLTPYILHPIVNEFRS